ASHSPVPVPTIPPILTGTVGDDEFERRAGAGGVDERDRAAMGADDLGGDGEAEAGAAGPGAALEGLEEMAAGAIRHPGAGVADADRHTGAVAAAAHGQPADDGRALVAAVER